MPVERGGNENGRRSTYADPSTRRALSFDKRQIPPVLPVKTSMKRNGDAKGTGRKTSVRRCARHTVETE